MMTRISNLLAMLLYTLLFFSYLFLFIFLFLVLFLFLFLFLVLFLSSSFPLLFLFSSPFPLKVPFSSVVIAHSKTTLPPQPTRKTSSLTARIPRSWTTQPSPPYPPSARGKEITTYMDPTWLNELNDSESVY